MLSFDEGKDRPARDLAQEIGISETNLSLLKSGKVKGIRFKLFL